MKINWQVRLRNKTFLTSLIALLLVLANQVAALFGADISIYNDQVTNLTESVLAILGLLGIVIDPSSPGIGDKEVK